MKDYSVSKISYDQAREWILQIHYAHRVCAISYAYGLFKDGNIVGACTFGVPPCLMNDGMFLGVKNILTRELTRLVIKDNQIKNAASFFISRCFKLLPKPMLLVSYADPNQGHVGYIYQATNWIYTGVSLKGGKDKQWKMGNRTFHGKTITTEYLKKLPNYDPNLTSYDNWRNNGGIVEDNIYQKHRYFYILGSKKFKLEIKKLLELKYLLPLPYPKGESKRYEINSLVKKGLLY